MPFVTRLLFLWIIILLMEEIPAPVDSYFISLFTRFLYIPGGCLGFLPTTVSSWDDQTRQCVSVRYHMYIMYTNKYTYTNTYTPLALYTTYIIYIYIIMLIHRCINLHLYRFTMHPPLCLSIYLRTVSSLRTSPPPTEWLQAWNLHHKPNLNGVKRFRDKPW